MKRYNLPRFYFLSAARLSCLVFCCLISANTWAESDAFITVRSPDEVIRNPDLLKFEEKLTQARRINPNTYIRIGKLSHAVRKNGQLSFTAQEGLHVFQAIDPKEPRDVGCIDPGFVPSDSDKNGKRIGEPLVTGNPHQVIHTTFHEPGIF